MIDMQVQNLLQYAIDSPVKLQLLLLFYEHPYFEMTDTEMAERACRDVWSVRQGLKELTEDGILRSERRDGKLVYLYQPRQEYVDSIRTLVRNYNDPLERNHLRSSIRDLAPMARFRRSVLTETTVW